MAGHGSPILQAADRELIAFATSPKQSYETGVAILFTKQLAVHHYFVPRDVDLGFVVLSVRQRLITVNAEAGIFLYFSPRTSFYIARPQQAALKRRFAYV